jgi:hypothetical protein
MHDYSTTGRPRRFSHGYTVDGPTNNGLFQGAQQNGPRTVRSNGNGIRRKFRSNHRTTSQQPEPSLRQDTVHRPTFRWTKGRISITDHDQTTMNRQRQTFTICDRRGATLSIHICSSKEDAQAHAQNRYPRRQTFVRPEGSKWI